MITLLDSDGPMSKFNKRCLDRIRDQYDISLTEDDIRHWGWVKYHPDIPKEALRKLVDEWIHERGFVLGMDVVEGAQEAVAKLRELGPVVCVTSPWHSDLWQRERHIWLEKHFGFKDEDIVQTRGKHHVIGNLLIDDKLSNVTGWLEGIHRWIPKSKAYGALWDMPHNRSEEDCGLTWARVSGWDAALDMAERVQDWASR